ncbi:uncharacterized protein [Cherax quadricarinatus]|uniref:uncharacterized protein n=1 Tax=Cherax quadricarinatus TaxID=27406 RepID=UPI00387EBDC9
MAHPHDSLTPRRINTLLFEESDRDHEFSGFDTNGASNIQGISENIDDNPDDPQPITSGVATPVLGPSTSGVASVATSDPRPSTSGVASVATEDPGPSTSGVASVTHRQRHKRKLSFSLCFSSDSESDVSDDEIDFMPIEDSSSDSDAHYSPVKRSFRCRYLRSGSVPNAIPKGRGRSRSKTPATDSESDHEGEYVGMEEVVVGGMVPGPHCAVGGQRTARHPLNHVLPPLLSLLLLPPLAPCHRSTLHHVILSGTGHKVYSCHSLVILMLVEVVSLYFDKPIMNLIVTQTNIYYQYVMNNTAEVGESSRLHRWKDTTVAELYLFLATVMLMPHIYKNNILRRNRKHMPRFTGGSVEGEVQAFHANDIMALTWHDKRDMTLLSTIHKNEMVQTDRLSKFSNEPIVKPLAVVDYTNKMRLVDKCDMMIGFVDCVRRSREWYIKLFFHLVDTAVLNAFNMYEVKTGKRQRFADFSLNLVKQIARKYGTTHVPSPQQ